MSIEGLWSAQFGQVGAAFQAVNAGIAVLETGRVFGGDTWFAYTGSYETSDAGIFGTLKIKRHHEDGQSIDAWGTGMDVFEIRFDLKWLEKHSLAEGIMHGPGGQALGLRLRKLAELP